MINTFARKSTVFSRKRWRSSSQHLKVLLFCVASLAGAFPLFCLSWKSSSEFSWWSSRCHGRGMRSRRRRRDIIVERTSTTKKTSLPSSLSRDIIHHQDDQLFPTDRPLLAIITETDACDTEEKMNYTYTTIDKSVSTGKVDLVCIRLSLPPRHDENGDDNESYHRILQRACTLTKKIVQLSSAQRTNHNYLHQDEMFKEDKDTRESRQLQTSRSFLVVCSSDLVSVAVKARANGIHFKERHLDQLPEVIRQFDYPIIIGTSTHSVEGALRSYFSDEASDGFENSVGTERNRTGTRPKPHYYFVGTCYMTLSHPEKKLQSQLEGPELPGRVKRALLERSEWKQRRVISGESREDTLSVAKTQLRIPRIMAIGGIDETNCHHPIALGADGVAVIRAVLQADSPIDRIEEMQSNMMRSYEQFFIE